MKLPGTLTLGSLALAALTTAASAVDITIDKNGFDTHFCCFNGGIVTGPSGFFQSFTAGTNASTFTGLIAGGTYSVDFMHNSGVASSDFSFTINGAGTGIASVGLGGGMHTMVTGFTPGDTTLTLNTHSITLNANGRQDGTYYVGGLFPPSAPANSPPLVKTAIPGWYSWDNLYNSGGNNEDFQFRVFSDGSTGYQPGYGEYASFGGSDINPIAALVHYKIEASSAVNWILDYTMFNFTNYTGSGPLSSIFEFDMLQTPGNAGINIWSFGSNTFVSGNITRSTNFSIHVAGASVVGDTSGNDAHFKPRLRYTWTNLPSASTDFTDLYWENTDANHTVASALITGYYDGNVTPLTVLVTATIIPEPSSVVMVLLTCVGAAFMARGKHHRRA